jgi:hypothetical protein
VSQLLSQRSTAVELGKLKVHKKSNGKTTMKLLTYPRLVETTTQDIPWESYGLTWSAIFHFLLIIGAGVRRLANRAWAMDV